MASSSADDGDVVSALAGWCEDKMRAIAVGTEPLPTPDCSWHIETCNENYDEFLTDLKEEQEIELPVEGPPQDDWVEIALDFLRVYHLSEQFKDEDANYTAYWYRQTHSTSYIKKLNEATTEHFQEWMFNLSWDMAKLLLKHKSVSTDKESSSDSDDDEEEGEEEDSSEEEEESESSEGSGNSDSEEDDDDDDELAGYSATKKQKTDKE